MSALRSALTWLGRRAVLVIAIGVFAGLLLPQLASLLRPLLLVAIMLPFLIALVRLDVFRLAAHLRSPWLLVLVLGWLMIVLPLLTLAASRALALPEALEVGLVLSAAAPPLMASAALALILGLDTALAVLVTVAGTAMTPLTLPLLALLLEAEIHIGARDLMSRLTMVVAGAFVAAALLRCLLPRGFADRHADPMNGFAALGLLVFAIAIMDGATAMLLRDPGHLLAFVGAVYAANVGFQVLGACIFASRGPSTALTLGLCAGNVNLGLLVAALADHANDELIVYVAMAQLPVCTLPLLQRPLYARWLRRERDAGPRMASISDTPVRGGAGDPATNPKTPSARASERSPSQAS